MKFGLKTDELKLLEELLINPLKDKRCRVWIFGSRARGDHRPFSDIDVLYEIPKGQTISLSELSEIKENLEQSNLAYKVDIINTEDLAESYAPGVLRDRVSV